MSRLGWADLGMATQSDMRANAEMIASLDPFVPLVADADTGYGGPIMVTRTVIQYARSGVAALHIEDQVYQFDPNDAESTDDSTGARETMWPPSGQGNCLARHLLQPLTSSSCSSRPTAIRHADNRPHRRESDLRIQRGDREAAGSGADRRRHCVL